MVGTPLESRGGSEAAVNQSKDTLRNASARCPSAVRKASSGPDKETIEVSERHPSSESRGISDLLSHHQAIGTNESQPDKCKSKVFFLVFRFFHFTAGSAVKRATDDNEGKFVGIPATTAAFSASAVDAAIATKEFRLRDGSIQTQTVLADTPYKWPCPFD